MPFLDGLRGVAAVAVVFCHLMLSFYFTLGFGSRHYFDRAGHYPTAPATMVWGGGLAVCIFFVLSGYVLVGMALNSERGLANQILRRVVRLGIPITVAILFSYAIWRLGLYANLAAADVINSDWLRMFYKGRPDIFTALRETFLLPVWPIVSEYNATLWTMHIEYLASFGLLAVYCLIKNRTLRISIAMLIFGLTFGKFYADFCAGALFADLGLAAQSQKLKPWALRTIAILLLVLFMLFGAYPWSGGVKTPWFGLDRFVQLIADDPTKAHILAAMFLLPAVLMSTTAKKLLASRPMVELGRQSFAIYLLHWPLLCFVGCSVFLDMLRISSYFLSFCVTATVVCGVTYVLAMFFTAYVDEPATKLSRQMSEKIFRLMPYDLADLFKPKNFNRKMKP